MHLMSRFRPVLGLLSVAGLACVTLPGCSSPEANVALVAGATLFGGQAPSNEIQQIYYLGVFDPQGQLPPSVYRVRVRGQASFISATKFASGWVPAQIIDSLGTDVSFKGNSGQVEFQEGDSDKLASLTTGRRLMMFGPEGFREAPRDHRLVVVMGSSPEAYFQAVDQALGIASQAQHEQRDEEVNRLLFEAITQAYSEQRRLKDLLADIERREAGQEGGEL